MAKKWQNFNKYLEKIRTFDHTLFLRNRNNLPVVVQQRGSSDSSKNKEKLLWVH